MTQDKPIPAKIHFFHNSDFFSNRGRYKNTHESLESWKKYLPDCQLYLWHESLPEFQMMLANSRYLRECYKYRLWAMVSDYVRAWVLYEYGGVYLDTDLILLHNVDHLRENKFFAMAVKAPTVRLATSTQRLPSGVDFALEPAFLGAVAGHKFFSQVLKIYNSSELFCSQLWIANCVYTLAMHRAYVTQKVDFVPSGEYADHGRSLKKKKCAAADLPAGLFAASAQLEEVGGILVLPGKSTIYAPSFLAQGTAEEEVAKTGISGCYAWHKCDHSWGNFLAKVFMKYKHRNFLLYRVMMGHGKIIQGWIDLLRNMKGRIFKKHT
ncbi:MAG: glycosyltransferase family 32 protein [Spirochaetia bacterium]